MESRAAEPIDTSDIGASGDGSKICDRVTGGFEPGEASSLPEESSKDRHVGDSSDSPW